MSEKDFDVLDNSLTLRNLTLEQKKSVARLMELAIDEARQESESFQQGTHRTGFWAGVGVGMMGSAVFIVVLLIISLLRSPLGF